MQDYELTLIFKPEMEEEAVVSSVERIEQLVAQQGGVVSTVDRWGKRRLAYPIKKFVEGIYIIIRFQMEPQQVVEWEARVNIDDGILRFLVVKGD